MRAFLTAITIIVSWLAVCLVVFPAKSEPVHIGHCSASYIGNGYILTAGHCVQDNLVVVKQSHTSAEGYLAELQVTNPGVDFAIYRLLVDAPFTATPMSCKPTFMRQHFIIKGWPGRLGYTEVIGYVAGETTSIGPWEAAQVVIAPVFYGSSGSGAYDVHDTIVGIIVGMLPGTSLAIMVPTSEICARLPILK